MPARNSSKVEVVRAVRVIDKDDESEAVLLTRSPDGKSVHVNRSYKNYGEDEDWNSCTEQEFDFALEDLEAAIEALK